MEAAAHGHSTLGIPKSVGQEFVNADKRADATGDAEAKKPRCAGLLLRSGGKYLLVKRADSGLWEHPGGHIENGENAKTTAVREAKEETGLPYNVEPRQLRRSNEDVDYTTFFADGPSFDLNLSDEHTDADWFGYGELPDPMHQEVQRSIEYIEHELDTELAAARAVRDGKLPNGFKYENTHLIALRIFGTGVSYRTGLKEFTFRDPELYLNDETLARCNGLPVVIEHPSDMLDGQEYESRNIGSIFLPYVQDDEVWGIARIYDGDIAKVLTNGGLSTSPGVRITPEDSEILPIDEDHLLIEGNPKLIDHIAIVENGVWDKGGPPVGIRNDAESEKEEGEKKYGDVKFADPKDGKYPIDTEEHIRAAWNYIHKGKDSDKYSADDLAAVKKRIIAAWKDKIDPKGPPEANNRKDDAMAETEKAPHEQLLDAISKMSERMDSICSRMDTMDKRDADDEDDKKDADEDKEKSEKEDKKDGAHEEEGKAEMEALKQHKAEEKEDKKDAAASENAALRAQIASMQARIDGLAKPPSYEEMERIASVQSRADGVLQLHGSRAPQPMAGESARAYHLRVLSSLRSHSDRFKDIELDKLDGIVLEEVSKGIFNDAQASAANPKNVPVGRLIPVTTVEHGHTVTRYHGDIEATFAPFMRQPLRGRINNPRRGGNA